MVDPAGAREIGEDFGCLTRDEMTDGSERRRIPELAKGGGCLDDILQILSSDRPGDLGQWLRERVDLFGGEADAVFRSRSLLDNDVGFKPRSIGIEKSLFEEAPPERTQQPRGRSCKVENRR